MGDRVRQGGTGGPPSPRFRAKAYPAMRCVDVNVLVYAHRADLPEHPDYRAVLERPPMTRSRWVCPTSS